MVHHGLVPGQTGDYAHRRLYVDLLVFPLDGLPRDCDPGGSGGNGGVHPLPGGPRPPGAAPPGVPHLISTVPGSFADDSHAAAVSDGMLACAGLTRQESASRILRSLTQRHLTDFESYAVAEFATEYFCPNEIPQGSALMQSALLHGP